MILTISLFILGFIFLIKGADILVDGSSSIAKKHGISNLVIGLTIVAFGTSAPELIVSALASFNGNAGIAFGNIIGSNISNTLLILGATALIAPLVVQKSTVNKEIPLSLLASLAVFFLVNDVLIDHGPSSALTRIDGLILILFFIIFIYYTFGINKVVKPGIIEKIQEEKINLHSTSKSVGMILLGLTGLYFGGQWIVDGAVFFALSFGLSQSFIGLTIVAIGTSLPELAASIVSARKGHTDIAIGNIIGSNIFNLFWVLGLSSIIRPIPFDASLNFDFIFLIFITIMLLPIIFIGRRHAIDKTEGAILLSTYVAYMVFLLMRG